MNNTAVHANASNRASVYDGNPFRPIRRFEIWLADLPLNPETHVQGGLRPVLIMSCCLDANSPVVSVIPLTSKRKRLWMDSHVLFRGAGMRQPSLALIEQVTTIDKRILVRKIGALTEPMSQNAINEALIHHMGLGA